jgi:single-stranded-DNA-specific exonuclease
MKSTLKWQVVSKNKSKKLAIPDIVDILLYNRGIRTKEQKKEFFRPTPPDRLTVNSLGLRRAEMAKAIQRIKKAKQNKEDIIVYGDYDADGICGTAILWETLYSLGLKVLPYIPERFTEGYGLNASTISKLKTQNSNLGLIITVDHGIVARKKIDVAKELGIDVIITDHHEPGKVKPKPFAVIHTQKISGSAVAWVFSREIRKRFKIQDSRINNGNGLELAAIGTIADQLPLIGPNRSFAKYGLEALRETVRPGILALFTEAQLKSGSVGPYEVGFMIAPRLNAMGRLSHAIDSLRLLCTKNVGQARELAAKLGRTNKERQRIVDEVILHARKSVRDTPGIIVLAHESYHEGVIGLAAAKLVEEFYRPAIVLAKKKDISKASARSIAGFNIIETIRKLESFYLEGGGHPMAAGFSIETVKLAEFTREIQKMAVPLLTPEILTKKLRIDMELNFNQLNRDLLAYLKHFEPTGLGNPTPTFVVKGVTILAARQVGTEGKHLKFKLGQDGIVFDAIGFSMGGRYSELSSGEKTDVVASLEEDFFNGRDRLQLKIKDIRVSH